MLEQLRNLMSEIGATLQTKSDSILSKLQLFLDKETITIEELATYIKQHADTEVKIKHLLGLTFQFYQLTFNNVLLNLETKNNKILEITITFNQKIIFQYHSYDEKHSPFDTIKIPAVILEH